MPANRTLIKIIVGSIKRKQTKITQEAILGQCKFSNKDLNIPQKWIAIMHKNPPAQTACAILESTLPILLLNPQFYCNNRQY